MTAKGLKGLSHVKTFKESVFLIILAIQLFFTIKLRINTIKSPIPIKAKEKVSKKDNPIMVLATHKSWQMVKWQTIIQLRWVDSLS